jgi:two-component system, chemotaxis family, sensor kinase CheA
MMIEDEELREMYKTASAEHLQKLEQELMCLEKHPSDRASLEEFLREAHTLKGDSRMLGLQDIETLLHQVEDCLAAVKRGESILTPQLCDRLYQGLDAIGKLAHEAVTGEAAGVKVFLTLIMLMGGESDFTLEPETPVSLSQEDASFAELEDFIVEENEATEDWGVPANSYSLLLETGSQLEFSTHSSFLIPHSSSSLSPIPSQIDTIRVEAQKLDQLLAQAGELTVTQLRIVQRIDEIEQILALWEDWSRDTKSSRAVLNAIERGLYEGNLKQIVSFQQRVEQRLEQLGAIANRLKGAATEDTARLETLANELGAGIGALRLLPLSTLFDRYPRFVRDLTKDLGKQVNLVIEGAQTKADKRIVEEMQDALLHLIRNAIDHGIETPQEREKLGKPPTATIRLRGYQIGDSIGIEVTDDGRGLDIESIKLMALQRGIYHKKELAALTIAEIQSLIFQPGFSTKTELSEISGRGIGLDVVRANVERLKGTIQVESTPGVGCAFRFRLNATVATTRVLLVEVNRATYAIPLEAVETIMLVPRHDIFEIESSQAIAIDGQPISVVWLADLLEMPVTVPNSTKTAHSVAKILSCILLKVGTERLGLLVDEVLDELNVVLKPQSKLLKRVRNVTGATILSNGEVCIVLNPQDLLKSARRLGSSHAANPILQTVEKKPSLLLVEDSIIIRTQMQRLLAAGGYQVITAVDGSDGFNKLKAGHFDAVVTDIEMPNLNGWELIARIRQSEQYSELPIIIVTTLISEEDKRRGAQVGANAYLTKGDFDQKVLLETLKQLI